MDDISIYIYIWMSQSAIYGIYTIISWQFHPRSWGEKIVITSTHEHPMNMRSVSSLYPHYHIIFAG